MRDPLVVVLLSIVTLGIYALYWIYKSFQELKDYSGEGAGGVAGLLLAIFVGPVVWFLLPHETGKTYERSSLQPPVGAATGFWCLIPLVGGIVWIFKVQRALNAYWELPR